jgi:hypothetical protein
VVATELEGIWSVKVGWLQLSENVAFLVQPTLRQAPRPRWLGRPAAAGVFRHSYTPETLLGGAKVDSAECSGGNFRALGQRFPSTTKPAE